MFVFEKLHRLPTRKPIRKPSASCPVATKYDVVLCSHAQYVLSSHFFQHYEHRGGRALWIEFETLPSATLQAKRDFALLAISPIDDFARVATLIVWRSTCSLGDFARFSCGDFP